MLKHSDALEVGKFSRVPTLHPQEPLFFFPRETIVVRCQWNLCEIDVVRSTWDDGVIDGASSFVLGDLHHEGDRPSCPIVDLEWSLLRTNFLPRHVAVSEKLCRSLQHASRHHSWVTRDIPRLWCRGCQRVRQRLSLDKFGSSLYLAH